MALYFKSLACSRVLSEDSCLAGVDEDSFACAISMIRSLQAELSRGAEQVIDEWIKFPHMVPAIPNIAMLCEALNSPKVLGVLWTVATGNEFFVPPKA